MIDLFTLSQVVQQAAEAGVANYIKHTQPCSDWLKMREAYRWLATMGIRQAALNELIDNGTIQAHRKGKGKNSPLMVSKSDIMAAITAKKLGKLLTNN